MMPSLTDATPGQPPSTETTSTPSLPAALSAWKAPSAAGSLIVTEAGGLVGNFTGEADFLHRRETVAGAPKIYGQLLKILAPYSRVNEEDDASSAATASATASATAPATPTDATLEATPEEALAHALEPSPKPTRVKASRTTSD